MKIRTVLFNLEQWLSMIGKKTGIRCLVYNPITWAHFFLAGRRNGADFAAVIRSLMPEVHSVLDIGAGTGGYVYAFKKIGIRAEGVEYSRYGRFLGKMQGVQLKAFDCSIKSDVVYGFFDLAYSIEVAEHVPQEFAGSFVEFICKHSDRIIFSAAFPGQGGSGHINEQPKSYWIEKFALLGFRSDDAFANTLSLKLKEKGYRDWLPMNILFFKKS